MSKAITGAVELAGAIGMGVAVFFNPALLASPAFDEAWAALAMAGVASEAGALADALTQNRGMYITTRQPASNAGIIYGEARVGGVLIYASTTGSHKDQYNKVIAFTCHPIDAIVNEYLDGRQVYWSSGSVGQTNRGGVIFGGSAGGGNHYDPGNNKYNFDGLVYTAGHYGNDPVGTWDGGLHANDPTWGPSASGTPYGGDCSYVYQKVEYDSTMFASQPESRFTIRGKNNIWDPRTNTYGYTCNWALCVADVLMNTEWGFGVLQSEINVEQLIAAANLCDELVPLANGGSERRYTFNASFDTSSTPGDILQMMMFAACGRVTYSCGQWYVWPAAAYPVTSAFGQDDLIDAPDVHPYKSAADLYNRVAGTFIAPNYPYSPAGDLYDANGFDPDGFRQNNFNLQWQPTSYPAYAQDQLHGYADDHWLTLDGGPGNEKYMTLNLQGVISLATAQRLAKIKLLQNRLSRGTYTLRMKMGAWAMVEGDVFGFDFPQFGWSGKLLQVTQIQQVTDYPDDGAPVKYVVVQCADYDPNIYAWSITEELTILDTPAAPPQAFYTVEPPTEITCTSGAGTDVVNAEGVLTPRVQVSWTDPPDAYVTLIETQWSPTGQNRWTSVSNTPVGLGLTYITGVTAGQVIDVQVRSLRGNGAASVWDQIIGYTVSATSISSISSIGILSGIPFNVSNNALIDSYAGTITRPGQQGSFASPIIRVSGPSGPGTSWTLLSGIGATTQPAAYVNSEVAAAPATGLQWSTEYYVCATEVVVRTEGQPTQTVLSFFATVNEEDILLDGNIFIGAITTCANDGSGGVTGGGSGTKGGPRSFGRS